MRRAGTLAGDRAHYAGQHLLGFTRSSTAGVMAFDAEGRVVGMFKSEKAAASALSDSERQGGRS